MILYIDSVRCDWYVIHCIIFVQDGQTALHLACVGGHLEVVQQFVDLGCNDIIDIEMKVHV